MEDTTVDQLASTVVEILERDEVERSDVAANMQVNVVETLKPDEVEMDSAPTPLRVLTNKLCPTILGMATGNPSYACSQENALAMASGVPNTDSVQPMLPAVYGNTKIENRFMCVPDYSPKSGKEPFFDMDLTFQMPIEKRLAKFWEEAVPLCIKVCQEAIAASKLSNIGEIGKIVVVSSTGFHGPGLDCALIKALGLSRHTDRTLVSFMGCAAAMNGFRVCNDYVVAQEGQKAALLCCIELSSPHMTYADSVNDAILHAIFADGCAAAVVGGRRQQGVQKKALGEGLSKDAEYHRTSAPTILHPQGIVDAVHRGVSSAPSGTFSIFDTSSMLFPDTEEGIVLSVNEEGISCTLSKHLPSYIAKGLATFVDEFLEKNGLVRGDMDFWAVHPGGRRIIEACEKSLDLTLEETKYSWAVLREYGNMLSPSVMFVMEKIMEDHRKAVEDGKKGFKTGIAFSFSPGIGVEGILINVN